VTALVMDPAQSPGTTIGRNPFHLFLTDVWVLTKRSIARIRREPETLSDVTIQPVLFVLMFAFVFGGAIGGVGRSGGGFDYHSYLIGGMLGMSLAQTAPGTAVAIVSDMETGLIDRFRSLPMSRAAVLTARTIADLLTQVIGGIVVALVGLAIGWRIHNGAGDAIEAFALALLFGYAFTWVGVCLGMVLRSPEAAQQTGFVLFLPLTFISSAFVPTQSMPGWLQPVAEWNPMSSLATACRSLFGNTNPASLVHAWPTQHPELAVVCWSAGLLVVFAPLAIRLYGNKVR
jgi:ABC-2 type transport system permease protein